MSPHRPRPSGAPTAAAISIAVGLAGLASACAKEAKPARSPQQAERRGYAAKAPADDEARSVAQEDDDGAPDRAELAPPPEAGDAPPDTSAHGAQLGRLSADFDRAEAFLRAGAADCDRACRALSSMRRAANSYCSLAQSGAERARCHDARRRLARAEARVRATCPTCTESQPHETLP